jgi:hypothetical protein
MKALPVFVIGLCIGGLSCAKKEEAPKAPAPAKSGDKETKQTIKPEKPDDALKPGASKEANKKQTTEKAKAPSKPPPPHRLAVPKLPKVPDDNILILARRVATTCKPKDTQCPVRTQLAAKITADLKITVEVLQTGTDMAKKAIRSALLNATDPSTDALLLQGLIDASGAVNVAVLRVAKDRMLAAAVKPLQEHIKKAAGSELTKSVEALGIIGGAEAVKQLKSYLTDKRLNPYVGTVCQALSRTLTKDTFSQIDTLAKALNRTERQDVGCGGAGIAFRILDSGTELSLIVGGRQHRSLRVLAYQKPGDPMAVHLDVTNDASTSCETPKHAIVSLRVPLDRAGQPVTKRGLVPTLSTAKVSFGQSPIFLFTLKSLVLKRNRPVEGTVHLDHRKTGDPRIIMSGHFAGTYCGVRK